MISRRQFFRSASLMTLALASPSFIWRCTRQRRPNVVIFLTDDQGTLDVNCYGAQDLYTPTMDELARTGVRFTQAYAHTVCCPTRAWLLTGRYPQRSGVNVWMQGDAHDAEKGSNMAVSEITLAEALREAGYTTGLFGKWHLGAHFDHGPTEQGYEEFFGIRDGFIDNYRHYMLHGRGYHDLYEGKQEVFADGKFFPDLITARAIRFLEKNKERPFFLYVPFNTPHYPEQPDPDLEEHYAHLPEPRRSYARVITTTDRRMGLIMQKLEELGLRRDTIVIFMSDNGHSEEDYQINVDDHTSGYPRGHNYGANGGGGYTGKWIGSKNTFLEGGVRVPAIISYPGVLPENVVRDQAITVGDWYPTILGLCGIATPDIKLDGRDLRGVIQSPSAASPHETIHWQWHDRWAVRQGDWKLIRERENRRMLVNLADTEPERVDYYKERPDIVTRLEALHDVWEKDVMAEG